MAKASSRVSRTLDARPDTPDFRDKLYEATLVEVPPEVPLTAYRRVNVPVLDQGTEGACTGFGLATVANYLIRRSRLWRDKGRVSPRMFYEMARRYDEWPGEAYDGSSARGAMKGWHKHGVCADAIWPYRAADGAGTLDDARATDASERPLGAYYRVNHKDLVCMHSALAEVGILYATARVHDGWQAVAADGKVRRTDNIIGGHAFAIVAYDPDGLWIQNSWGEDWGRGGFGHVSYDDWLANGTDVWVARLGAPVRLTTTDATARVRRAVAGGLEGYAFHDVRPHVISLGNDGRLRDRGTYATGPDEVRAIFEQDIPRVTATWPKKRILLYAHGGLVDEQSAIGRAAELRTAMLRHHVYPLAFVWRSDFWSTLKNILADAFSRRAAGIGRAVAEFMQDRVDDVLEPLARTLGGKAQWDEMKENAHLATKSADGGARLAMDCLAKLCAADPTVEVHVAGHSAGSVFHAPLVQYLTGGGPLVGGPSGLDVPIASCALWAPACTVSLFKRSYLPAVRAGKIARLAMFTLTDTVERDDTCANLYQKSLLYLVSNAFESRTRIPLFREEGEPILGMARHVRRDGELMDLFEGGGAGAGGGTAQWVLSPNTDSVGSAGAARSTTHSGFDNDDATVRATLARILDVPHVEEPPTQQPIVRDLSLQEMGMPVATDRKPKSSATRRGKSKRGAAS
jgi:hypothetical protein